MFSFVYIPRSCRARRLGGAQVKILLLASILTCRAENSGIINKITVLSFSIVFFSIYDIPGSTFGD